MLLQKYTQCRILISYTLILHKLTLYIVKQIVAYVLGANSRLLSNPPSIFLSLKTHSSNSVLWQKLSLQIVLKFWSMSHLLSPKAAHDLPSTVLYVEVKSDFKRVFNCWNLGDLLPTDQILPQCPTFKFLIQFLSCWLKEAQTTGRCAISNC